jgi:hypothetical protein
MTIRAHFDGKVLVPDEPLDLPINEPLDLELLPSAGKLVGAAIEEQLARLNRASGRIRGPVIPPEALRRSALYEERT